ncbi:hypothetical protein NX722_28365 [Endozoicomonas gorgoniicola]|uniref:Uncharacterized protein n=1 Tax=Endozoicomonas gorgoniicola TaxID=1234144 RepID=A0ABT3N4D3_9GAMM|nr:hypothetical protein [Endozoicomonas gorgoniicola]MCW7556481.1 hypothetical protein [Endozoicomonas gorgoniicola]
MSYVEFSNVMFRGKLAAATGEAQFKVIGDKFRAETFNIEHGAVSYSQYIEAIPVSKTYGSVLLDYRFNIRRDSYVEFIASTVGGCIYLVVDGVRLPDFVNWSMGNGCFSPLVLTRFLSAGDHRVQVIARYADFMDRSHMYYVPPWPNGGFGKVSLGVQFIDKTGSAT